MPISQPGQVVLVDVLMLVKKAMIWHGKAMARSADVFVMDAFASSHRAHASTVAVAQAAAAVAGLLLEQELYALQKVMVLKSIPW